MGEGGRPDGADRRGGAQSARQRCASSVGRNRREMKRSDKDGGGNNVLRFDLMKGDSLPLNYGKGKRADELHQCKTRKIG